MLRGPWRKLLLALVLGIPALGATLWFLWFPWYVRRGAFTPDIEHELSGALGLKVTIGALEGSVLDGVVLRSVVGADPATGKPVLRVEEIRVAYDPLELRTGRIRSVVLVEPRIEILRDASARWNWGLLAGPAAGPVVLPAAVDDFEVQGGAILVRTDALVARAWDLDLDLGAIHGDQAIRVRLRKPARVGIEGPVAYDIDPLSLEAHAITLACDGIEAQPISGPFGLQVKGCVASVGDLAALDPLGAIVGLDGWEVASQPAVVRIDAEFGGGAATLGCEGETPGLRFRNGAGPWTEAGGRWSAHAKVSFDGGAIELDRSRFETERYGTWAAAGSGSWQTQDFLLRELRIEGLELGEIAKLPPVAGAGWSMTGGVLLSDVSGRIHRDAAGGTWAATLSGAGAVPRFAGAYETDRVRLKADGGDLRWNLGWESRSQTISIGVVGQVASAWESGGGYEFTAAKGIDGLVFQGTYRWGEGERVFESTQIDGRIADLSVRRLASGTLVRIPEPVSVGFDFVPGAGGEAPLRYDRVKRRVTVDGLRLTPQRGGILEISARGAPDLKGVESVKVSGRAVELGFLQGIVRETLGQKAGNWSVTGAANFDATVLPKDAEGDVYEAIWRMKGDALSIESVVDPRPIGAAVDASGRALLDLRARTLFVNQVRARLGERGQAEVDVTLDLDDGWPAAGTVRLAGLDGPWVGDIARRVTRISDDAIDGGGLVGGTLTFGTTKVGERKDAQVSFAGAMMRSRLTSKAYDVELSGKQIDLRCDLLLPGRKFDEPMVSFAVKMAAGSMKSDKRLYEANPLDMTVSGELRVDRARDTVEATGELTVTRAEIVWDTLYDPIAKDPIFVKFKGGWEGARSLVRVDRFACQHPNFGVTNAKGEFTLARVEDNVVAVGRLDFSDTSFTVREISVIGLDARVPFHVGYPMLPESQVPEGVREADWAHMTVQAIEKGRFRMEGVDLEAALFGDRILTRRPIELPLFGGVLRFRNFEGKGLIPASVNAPWQPEWRADVEVAGIKPGLALYASGSDRELPGVANGRFEHASFAGAMLDLQGGGLDLDLLGGKAAVRNLRVRNPLSHWRLEGDVDLTGADLMEFCRVFPEFGQIEGKVDASVRGLAVFEGTPVEFDLDVDNAAYASGSGIRQAINHQAAQNLGYLGGGVKGVFEENVKKRTFKYINFGVVARMRYDDDMGRTLVRLRGKYQKTTLAIPPISTYARVTREEFGPELDGKIEGKPEYFIVGATTSGVNLINGEPKGVVDYVAIFDRVKEIIDKGAEGMHVK